MVPFKVVVVDDASEAVEVFAEVGLDVLFLPLELLLVGLLEGKGLFVAGLPVLDVFAKVERREGRRLHADGRACNVGI